MNMYFRRSLPAALFASAALALSGLLAPHGPASARPSVTDCEGDACAQVTLTFDEAKGQYLARNNSGEAWVRFTASNMSAAATVCVAPGKADYLPLKSITGAFRAERGASCGGGTGT
jgi:hypothetical protein